MPTLNLLQAVNDALRVEMRRDPRTIVLGEDVGKFGGVFRATAGLYEDFGPDRVIDTSAGRGRIIGTASRRMAMYGLKPVPEIQFSDFIFPGFDQNRLRAVQAAVPIGRAVHRAGGDPHSVRRRNPRRATTHSQSPEALFIHQAGLKVVAPSNPYDAKGLLLAAMRQPDPIIFFEPKRGGTGPRRARCPEGDYEVPPGGGEGAARRHRDDGDRLGRGMVTRR